MNERNEKIIAEFQFLVSAKEDAHPLYAAYVLIVVLGLRRGELLGLTWPMVDLETAQLQVGYSLQRIGGRLVHGETKTEASDAVLPLPAICLTDTPPASADPSIGDGGSRPLLGSDWLRLYDPRRTAA